MNLPLESSIQIALALQLVIAFANFFAPAKLHYRENLVKVSPIVRQIFTVHSVFIVLVLVGFGLICLLYPKDLCGASQLGRFIGGFLGVFWVLRVILQFTYYDRKVKEENPLGTFCFGIVFLYLATIFTITLFFAK